MSLHIHIVLYSQSEALIRNPEICPSVGLLSSQPYILSYLHSPKVTTSWLVSINLSEPRVSLFVSLRIVILFWIFFITCKLFLMAAWVILLYLMAEWYFITLRLSYFWLLLFCSSFFCLSWAFFWILLWIKFFTLEFFSWLERSGRLRLLKDFLNSGTKWWKPVFKEGIHAFKRTSYWTDTYVTHLMQVYLQVFEFHAETYSFWANRQNN